MKSKLKTSVNPTSVVRKTLNTKGSRCSMVLKIWLGSRFPMLQYFLFDGTIRTQEEQQGSECNRCQDGLDGKCKGCRSRDVLREGRAGHTRIECTAPAERTGHRPTPPALSLSLLTHLGLAQLAMCTHPDPAHARWPAQQTLVNSQAGRGQEKTLLQLSKNFGWI